MASETKTSSPSVAVDTSTLYNAVEALKENTVSAFNAFENDGSYSQLTSDLGYIRDRADAIQTAAIQVATALEQNL